MPVVNSLIKVINLINEFTSFIDNVNITCRFLADTYFSSSTLFLSNGMEIKHLRILTDDRWQVKQSQLIHRNSLNTEKLPTIIVLTCLMFPSFRNLYWEVYASYWITHPLFLSSIISCPLKIYFPQRIILLLFPWIMHKHTHTYIHTYIHIHTDTPRHI